MKSRPEAAWQLLDEFSEPGQPGSGAQWVERVGAAAAELGLQARQVERMEAAIIAALRQRTQEGSREPHPQPLCIRIWRSGAAVGHSPSDLSAPFGAHRETRGWGFFLIQKENGARAPSAEPWHVVEVYLYQERPHPDGSAGGVDR